MVELPGFVELESSSEVALQHKGLILLQQLPPVVCRSIDTAQTNPSSLDANECGLTEVCLLEGESELQQLYLARNSIAAVLSCHNSGLAALTHLCLAHNCLVDVSGCDRLTALKVLRLGNNKLTTSSLQPLTGLSGLQVLDVHRNSLACLAPLAALGSLAVLNAAANKLQQLPCLTALTALTELNLRQNHLTSLVPATAATLSAGAAALPPSLVRLSLAHNKLAQAALLLPLRQLPLLADLCADGNPFAAGSSRGDMLACCPPSLLMLDMQTVSPVERVLILNTAAKITAAQRSRAAAAQHAASPATAAPGELAVCTVQAQHRAGKCSTTVTVCRENWQESCVARQPQEGSSQQDPRSDDSSCRGHMQQVLPGIQQHEEPRQQGTLSQAAQLMRISQPAALTDNVGSNQPHSTSCSTADAAGGGSSAASVVAPFRPSIAQKLRPHSAGGMLMSHAVAQSASGDGSRDSTGSRPRAGWPRAQSCIGAAAYRTTSSSSARAMHADRDPCSLSAAAAYAAARADGPAARLADLEADTLSSSGLGHEPEILAEATVLSHCHDAEHEGSCRSRDTGTAAEQPAGPATALGAGAGAATCEQATTCTAPAPAAAATQAAQAARYEGALAAAAVACGIAQPGVDVTASTAQLQAAADAASGKCRSAWEWGIEVYGAGGDPAAAAAAGGGSGADISTQELEEKYLQAKQATLADRHRQPQQQRVATPLPPPAEPGVSLTGSRLVLTGSAALGALRGQALAHVGDVTLEHMHCSQVMAALPLLAGLSRLSSLSLRQLSGLQVLPQLHPLLQLTGLRDLTVEECPLAGLVLLRPYVAFRLSGLLSFNSVPISQCEVEAAAELFGPLEAALAVALAQAPQQAALAAAGVMQAKGGMLRTSSSSGPNATVWCTGSSGSWQHMAAGNSIQQQGKCEMLTATSTTSTATGHNAPAASSAPASIAAVSRALAAVPAGPLLPSERCMSQGAAFASQLLAEAAGVQQQLAVLHDQAWPGLVEQSIHEGWYGHHDTGTVEVPR